MRLIYYDIFPFKVASTGPVDVMKGVPLKVATMSSLTKKSAANLLKTLVALLPGSIGLDKWPSNLINSPTIASFGGLIGDTCSVDLLRLGSNGGDIPEYDLHCLRTTAFHVM